MFLVSASSLSPLSIQDKELSHSRILRYIFNLFFPVAVRIWKFPGTFLTDSFLGAWSAVMGPSKAFTSVHSAEVLAFPSDSSLEGPGSAASPALSCVFPTVLLRVLNTFSIVVLFLGLIIPSPLPHLSLFLVLALPLQTVICLLVCLVIFCSKLDMIYWVKGTEIIGLSY